MCCSTAMWFVWSRPALRVKILDIAMHCVTVIDTIKLYF